MRNKSGYFYTLPLVLWLSVFFLIPLGIIMTYSFLQKGTYGGVLLQFSLEAYRSLQRFTILQIFWNTLYMAVLATVIIIFLALPAAYYIARSKHKNFLLFLIIIPFWINFLIRIYAWIAILGNNGFLNQLINKLQNEGPPIQFLYNPFAVIIVLAYTYLPFAILPLYSTIEKFDFSLLEAARDLGATKFEAFKKVLIPNIMTGVFAAILFSFIPAFGNYAVPQLVGGTSSYMLGNIIARELTVTRNWPLAAAMSTVLTLITIIGIILFMIQGRKTQLKETSMDTGKGKVSL
ncbi:MAG: ABC transporter permease [Candidatus Margulisbacteria bacterium]|nr:ABC transporter permease [Candidatus Margulisiibacteriota bacterium]